MGIGTSLVLKFLEILPLDLCLWTGRGGNWQIGSYRRPQEFDGAPSNRNQAQATQEFRPYFGWTAPLTFIAYNLMKNEYIDSSLRIATI